MYVRRKAVVTFETATNPKCNKNCTGNFVTYTGSRLAARLRSSSLSAVSGPENLSKVREASNLSGTVTYRSIGS